MKDKVVSLHKRTYKRKKKDSKWKSFSEALINVCISLPIAVAANAIFLPLFAESLYFTTDMGAQSIIYLELAAIFTVISITRMYLLRRLFNRFGTETGYSIIIKLIKSKRV